MLVGDFIFFVLLCILNIVNSAHDNLLDLHVQVLVIVAIDVLFLGGQQLNFFVQHAPKQ
jgi:hypothetical protein